MLYFSANSFFRDFRKQRNIGHNHLINARKLNCVSLLGGRLVGVFMNWWRFKCCSSIFRIAFEALKQTHRCLSVFLSIQHNIFHINCKLSILKSIFWGEKQISCLLAHGYNFKRKIFMHCVHDQPRRYKHNYLHWLCRTDWKLQQVTVQVILIEMLISPFFFNDLNAYPALQFWLWAYKE